MTYEQKLEDPRWKVRRSEIIIRDKGKCVINGCTKTDLQVHHTIYFTNKEPWEYADEFLVTLCDFHHTTQAYRFKYEEDLITSLRVNGFLASDILGLSTKLHNDPKFKDWLLIILRRFSNDI